LQWVAFLKILFTLDLLFSFVGDDCLFAIKEKNTNDEVATFQCGLHGAYYFFQPPFHLIIIYKRLYESLKNATII
jgi:hypothetical protein